MGGDQVPVSRGHLVLAGVDPLHVRLHAGLPAEPADLLPARHAGLGEEALPVDGHARLRQRLPVAGEVGLHGVHQHAVEVEDVGACLAGARFTRGLDAPRRTARRCPGPAGGPPAPRPGRRGWACRGRHTRRMGASQVDHSASSATIAAISDANAAGEHVLAGHHGPAGARPPSPGWSPGPAAPGSAGRSPPASMPSCCQRRRPRPGPCAPSAPWPRRSRPCPAA